MTHVIYTPVWYGLIYNKVTATCVNGNIVELHYSYEPVEKTDTSVQLLPTEHKQKPLVNISLVIMIFILSIIIACGLWWIYGRWV